MINEWLEYEELNPCPYKFKLINVSERKDIDEDVKSFLGKEIIESYRHLDFLKFMYEESSEQELIDYINKQVFSTDQHQLGKNVTQGDFGEILAYLIVTYFQGLTVPLRKMRWKFNKDKSVFSTDMVAHNSVAPLTDFYYYEIKTKLQLAKEYPVSGEPGQYITVIAHNSLLKEEQSPTYGIADFLLRLNYEKHDFEEATKWKDVVKNPNKYNRNYELFFVIEREKFLSNIITDLEDLPPSISPLNVTVVLIKNLGRLIVEMKKKAIDEAVNFVFEK
ncbi:Hachiman antiphage defense system protein HamA [Pontibacter sp. BAB1700]|uniref:Hachiman antiphage defense system protein HamA n=1 Tax=Pontibacter sp. BAB1700 TaxID=1144253 RepID=UPI00026BD1BA|nr:Hachiman antiphage defense system protein HamA [Pontibacter sp. BAB1700]EJF10972.1 hypothetical protein O71_06242 [Pontibacter sp. BAB1700]